MKKSDIYEIAVKILGLYMFTVALGLLHEMANSIIFNQANQYPESYNKYNIELLIVDIINFVLNTVFAWLLIFKSKAVVKLICHKTDYEETSKLFAEKKVIYEIAMTIMGLLLFIWTLPQFLYGIRNYIQLIPNDTQDASYIIVSGVKLFVGFCIIIYANSIAKYLAKDNNKSASSNLE